MRSQHTIARPIVVEGFGYWGGRDVRVQFRPAAPHTGLVFVRDDLPRPVRIPLDIRHRVETPRRTTLSRHGVSVEMIEHIVAACVGLQVDNCEIVANQAEMPGCDGSSRPFAEALLAAGIVLQPAARARWIVSRVTRVGDAGSWVEARPSLTGGFSLEYRLDYGTENPIGRQSIYLRLNPESFCAELAPARTFLLAEEAEWLRDRGLGARVSCRDLLVFDKHGPRDNRLRFPDECVRHKALDLVGDLGLANADLVGHFVAHRSGHRLNAKLVAALCASADGTEPPRAVYDTASAPIAGCA